MLFSFSIEVATKNVNAHMVNDQVNLKLADFKNINDKYDLIVSNPPYINENEYENLQIEVRKYEPKIALLGGKDGLKFFKLFANKIENNMNKNSIFICEIGYNQLGFCKNIFRNSSMILKNISKDIQEIDRTLTFFKI